MKKLTALLLALTLLFTSACASGGTPDAPDTSGTSPVQEQTPPADQTAPSEPAQEPAPEPEPETEPEPVPAEKAPYEILDPTVMPEGGERNGVKYEAYNGIVEHLFFHPIIAYPELAFDGDSEEKGLDDFMVTADEFWKIMDSCYANGYVLVDIGDVWSETTGDDGQPKMVRNTLYLPEGKKPLIFSYDDTNYYPYMLDNGFTYKLILDESGQVTSWGLDPDGKEVTSRELDAIPALDKFVEEHPDFSPFGAKASLSLTGYQGILGYRTQTDGAVEWTGELEANRQAEREAVKPIIEELKAGPSAATPGATSASAASAWAWTPSRRTPRSGLTRWAAWWARLPSCTTPTASAPTAATGPKPGPSSNICRARASGCSAPWASRASALSRRTSAP